MPAPAGVSSRRLSVKVFSGILVLVSSICTNAVAKIDPGKQDDTDKLRFFPYRVGPTGELDKPLDRTLFNVRLERASDRDEQYIYPCNQGIEPPSGRYVVWLEGADLISLQSTIKTRDSGHPLKPMKIGVFPAGKIRIPSSYDMCSGCTLRLVHIDVHARGPVLQALWGRRSSETEAKTGVFVPEGPVLVTLFDNINQEFVAVARPVNVATGKTTVVEPRPPTSGGDVVAILDRPDELSANQDPEIDLWLETSSDGKRTPDLVVSAAFRVIAVWFGVGDRYGVLTVSSSTAYLPKAEITIPNGGVVSHRSQLLEKPSLDIELELDEYLSKDPSIIEIIGLSDRQKIREAAVEPGTKILHFEDLPPKRVWARLVTSAWKFIAEADLSDGIDKHVIIAPQPLRVHGTVYYGDEACPATISFETRGDAEGNTKAETDARGDYEAYLYRRGVYTIQTDITKEAREPYSDFTYIGGDQQIDIHIPLNEVSVQVVNSRDNQGIDGASVIVDSHSGEKTISRKYVADEHGGLVLPPLQPGALVLRAEAEGFQTSEPEETQILESDEFRDLTVYLVPVEAETRLIVRLPNGTPASGVEAQLRRDLDSSAPLWSGIGDGQGELEVPRMPLGTFLLFRHETAGFTMILPHTNPTTEIQLPPQAPPLVIRVVGPNGETIRGAGLAIWTAKGGWATNRALSWLTWSGFPGTQGGGLWTAKGLPAESIRIVAWGSPSSRDLSLFDSNSAIVQYPWPNIVEIEALP